MTRSRVLIGTVVLLVLVVAAASVTVLVLRGGGPDAGDLAGRIPAPAEPGGTAGLVVVDLRAARDALDLAEDADPAGPVTGPVSELDEDQRAFRATLLGFPHVVSGGDTVTAEAMDLGAVSAAATNLRRGSGGLTVATTEQSLDDIAAVLEPAGYERDGDLLLFEDARALAAERLSYTAIGLRDGVLALSGDTENGRALVEAALAGERPDDGLTAYTEQLDGPVGGVRPGTDCVTAFGLDDPLDEDPVLVLFTDTPDDVEVVLEEREGVEQGDPVTTDRGIEVPLAPSPELFIGGIAPLLLGADLLPGDLYTCA